MTPIAAQVPFVALHIPATPPAQAGAASGTGSLRSAVEGGIARTLGQPTHAQGVPYLSGQQAVQLSVSDQMLKALSSVLPQLPNAVLSRLTVAEVNSRTAGQGVPQGAGQPSARGQQTERLAVALLPPSELPGPIDHRAVVDQIQAHLSRLGQEVGPNQPVILVGQLCVQMNEVRGFAEPAALMGMRPGPSGMPADTSSQQPVVTLNTTGRFSGTTGPAGGRNYPVRDYMQLLSTDGRGMPGAMHHQLAAMVPPGGLLSMRTNAAAVIRADDIRAALENAGFQDVSFRYTEGTDSTVITATRRPDADATRPQRVVL